MTDRIRILLADDHPIVLKGLRDLIAEDKRFEIVAESDNGAAAWNKIREVRPQVAVLDINLPDLNGLEILARIQDARLDVAVVLLTFHKEENIITSALELGVMAYVLKENTVNDLTRAIDWAAAGRVFLSPSISSYLLKGRQTGTDAGGKNHWIERLTPTEFRVLRLVADNLTNEEIARKLFNSPKTIKTHRNNICGKLDLQGRRSLLVFAMQHKEEIIRYKVFTH